MNIFELIKDKAKDKLFSKQVFSEEDDWNFSSCLQLSTVNNNAPFFDFISLSDFLSLSPQELSELGLVDQNRLYKTFYIDKKSHRVVPRSFPGKLREINAPVKELKELQKKLLGVFALFPVHPANNGFVCGKNIFDAATVVKDGEILIHIDLNKFFDNHSYIYVKSKLKEKFKESYCVELDDLTLGALLSLITRNGCLPQGAPTSPCLVVALNYELDEKIQALADKFRLSYSRYADDLAFSGDIDFSTARKFVKELAKNIAPFTINWNKQKIMKTSSKSILTGLEFIKTDGNFEKKEAASILKETEILFGKNVSNEIKNNRIKIVCSDMDKQDRNTVEANLELLSNQLISIVNLVIKPKFYYIQSTKHLLGMNIVDGKINYPRKDYENLRLIAMLVGRQILFQKVLNDVLSAKNREKTIYDGRQKEKFLNLLNIFSNKEMYNSKYYRNLIEDPLDIEHFWGLVSHLHMVDKIKEEKLKHIVASSYTKCYNQLAEFLSKVDKQELKLMFETNVSEKIN